MRELLTNAMALLQEAMAMLPAEEAAPAPAPEATAEEVAAPAPKPEAAAEGEAAPAPKPE